MHNKPSNQNKPIFDAPMMDELPPTPDFSDFPQDYHTTPTVQNNAIKVLMSKMISLLLNYPTLADGKVESRVKNIENSKVLLELGAFSTNRRRHFSARFNQTF